MDSFGFMESAAALSNTEADDAGLTDRPKDRHPSRSPRAARHRAGSAYAVPTIAGHEKSACIDGWALARLRLRAVKFPAAGCTATGSAYARRRAGCKRAPFPRETLEAVVSAITDPAPHRPDDPSSADRPSWRGAHRRLAPPVSPPCDRSISEAALLASLQHRRRCS